MSAVPAAAGPARLQGGCAQGLRPVRHPGRQHRRVRLAVLRRGVVDPAFGRPLDLAASWVFGLLFETKFYLLFSFLFGYSFTLQMAAPSASGFPAAPAVAGWPAMPCRRCSC